MRSSYRWTPILILIGLILVGLLVSRTWAVKEGFQEVQAASMKMKMPRGCTSEKIGKVDVILCQTNELANIAGGENPKHKVCWAEDLSATTLSQFCNEPFIQDGQMQSYDLQNIMTDTCNTLKKGYYDLSGLLNPMYTLSDLTENSKLQLQNSIRTLITMYERKKCGEKSGLMEPIQETDSSDLVICKTLQKGKIDLEKNNVSILDIDSQITTPLSNLEPIRMTMLQSAQALGCMFDEADLNIPVGNYQKQSQLMKIPKQ